MEFTDYGKCDRCDAPASFMAGSGAVVTERLCTKHREHDVKVDTLDCYVSEQVEREPLNKKYQGTVILISVHDNKNLDGVYVASIANPILGCSPGFGSTPARALRELGQNIADEADVILTRIKEHEFEVRQLQTELGEER